MQENLMRPGKMIRNHHKNQREQLEYQQILKQKKEMHKDLQENLMRSGKMIRNHR